jgi:hypothetical protein
MSRTLATVFPFSPVKLLTAFALLLALTYVALIAVVMSYAALTVSFTQSVRDDEASAATLESAYLAQVASISATDYTALGYETPTTSLFVGGAPATALR